MRYLVDRVHRNRSKEEIARIASTYHAWRGETWWALGGYEDVFGFSKSATLQEIIVQDHVLTPWPIRRRRGP